MPATRYSPILYSDYNALYNTIYTICGSISAGTGYGQTSFQGSAYPFTKTITSITKAAIAVVTTSTPHYLVAGEIIYIDNVAAGMVEINSTYTKVYSVDSPTQFKITVDTRSYTTWSGTATVSQFVVSANQFNNLRVDLAKARKHQTGSNVTTSELPLVTRGDIINFDVYSPFYALVDTVNAQKYVLGEYTLHQPSNSPFSRTAAWGSTLTAQIEIEWPSLTDAQQFFNTGGQVVFDCTTANPSTANTATGDAEWASLMTTVFPFRYGAYNKATMGYTDTSKWATQGFYDANGLDQTMKSATVSNPTYNSNTFVATHRAITDKKIRFTFVWTDGHTNTWSGDVNLDFTFSYYLYYTIGGITLANNPNGSTNPYVYSVTNAFNGPGNS